MTEWPPLVEMAIPQDILNAIDEFTSHMPLRYSYETHICEWRQVGDRAWQCTYRWGDGTPCDVVTTYPQTNQ
ncbi:MAG TPA: hypothetical protein VF174_05785, partial [Micromonosporaceae bacterium]